MGRKTHPSGGFCVMPHKYIFMPESLNILLLDNEPDGRKKITLPGWTGHCFVFPRNKLTEMGNNETGEELRGAGVYFIFGKKLEDNSLINVYIGKAGNIFDRLKIHNRENKFNYWNTTAVFTSDDMADNHHCLESKCIATAREAKHFGYDIRNQGNPAQQSHEFNTPFVDRFANNINLILATIGYPVLQKIEPKNEDSSDKPLFYCQRKNLKTNGTGRMTNEGFVFYEGSVITSKHSPAVVKRNNKKIEELLKEKIIKKDGDTYIFKKDYIFSRPSSPASLILGFAKDGWHAWKTQDGKTLDEIYRPK